CSWLDKRTACQQSDEAKVEQYICRILLRRQLTSQDCRGHKSKTNLWQSQQRRPFPHFRQPRSHDGIQCKDSEAANTCADQKKQCPIKFEETPAENSNDDVDLDNKRDEPENFGQVRLSKILAQPKGAQKQLTD